VGVAVLFGDIRGGVIDGAGVTLGGVTGVDAGGLIPPGTLGGSSGM
jgi:hypothetical protein